VARRRKRSPVPFMEWLTAFSLAQKMVARAYDEVAAEKPPALFGFGAILRLAVNHVMLPVLRKKLAENPGIETPEEIAKFVMEALDAVTEERVRAFLKTLGIKDVDKYTAAIMEYLRLIKEKLPEIAKTVTVAA